MTNRNITWTDNKTPKSSVFDDIYFNPDNGLDESFYVFIDGNNLTSRFKKLSNNTFTIAELGFGTGLNFMLTWHEFEKAKTAGKLHFISVEKYPLSKDDIYKALSPWNEKWGDKLDMLVNNYTHDNILDIQLTNTVRLTIYFDDVATALPQITKTIDAWYLDGFNPSKNKDMWTDTVFKQMARLSSSGTTFGTFTAAGFVKRGLQAVGFDVQKHKGFANKRECLYGEFKG